MGGGQSVKGRWRVVVLGVVSVDVRMSCLSVSLSVCLSNLIYFKHEHYYRLMKRR